MKKDKQAARRHRHIRIRKKMRGNPTCPRLCVFRTAKHIYVQAIDDLAGSTIVASSSLSSSLPQPQGELSAKRLVAKSVGLHIAQKLKDKGITKVVFDRAGFLYHGRIAALAEGAREGGLEF
jgi:large subunit ribosomal protein L18